MASLEQLIGSFIEESRNNRIVLAHIYGAIQQREAEKQADDWAPTNMILGSGHVYPILPRNARRNSFSIYNAGTTTVVLSNQHFEYNEAINWISNTSVGVFPAFLLAGGETFSINAKGAVYGAVSSNTQLQIVETYYKPWQGPPGTRGATPMNEHSEWMGRDLDYTKPRQMV